MCHSFRSFAVLGLITFAVANAQVKNIRVPGVVDGFQTKDKDGIVDAALVVPTFSTSEVFRFDLGGLQGPTEKAKAGPISADVPGNTYIPAQREKYGWITITIEKPEFGFFTPPGKENEISALWFSAPFDLIVDAGNGNVSIIDLLKSAKFRKAGFAGLKDWSRESKIFLSLDKELRTTGEAHWTRSTPARNQSDSIVVFQQTPANRWALSGFDGNPKTTSAISSVDGLSSRLKIFGVRSAFDGNNLISAEGWIVEAGRQAKVQFTGVPSPLKNASLSGNKVKWKTPGGTGWIGIIYQPKAISIRNQAPSIFDGLFPLTKLIPSISHGVTMTWVDPALEEFELPVMLGVEDGLTIIHIGTSKAVPAPREEEAEPELFTFAQSLRTVVVK